MVTETSILLLIMTSLAHYSGGNVVLLSHSPLVSNHETTSLTCADLTGNSSKSSLFIRRLFRWSGSATTQSSATRAVLNDTGMQYSWTGDNVAKAIGAFGCGRGDSAVSVVKMHVNGTLRPKYFSRIVTVGYKVVIEMELASRLVNNRLRKVTWYKNGHVIDTKSSSKSSRIWEAGGGRLLVISGVKPDDAGVYMAHHATEDKLYAAGTTLVVRGCVTNRWSPKCNRPCLVCRNRGYCDDKTGICICPPGFRGHHCEEACTPGYFGKNCEHRCSDVKNDADAGVGSCKGLQLCSIGGCSCMPGWGGPNCQKSCDSGYYGPGCAILCSCHNYGRCDRFRGCVCGPRWKGTYCKTPNNAIIRYSSPAPPVTPNMRNQEDDPDATEEQKPVIHSVTAIPSFVVNQGQIVEIHCSVTGVPAPQHGEVILRRKDMSEIAPSQTNLPDSYVTTIFSLVVGSYAGPFWCVATTRAGIAEKEFNFTISVLPVPTNPPSLISRTATSLHIKLNSQLFEGDGPINRSVLLFKQSSHSSFVMYESIKNDKVKLENLKPFTNYTFRVMLFRVGGESGRGAPGPMAVIRTDCGMPMEGPMIRNIHAINNTILYLSWSLPPANKTKGDVLGYKIYYKALGELSGWSKVEYRFSNLNTITMKNMKPLAVYSVKIRLYNCAGDSPYSKEVRVTMGRLKKPAGPTVILLNRTSRSIYFEWEPPANALPYTISTYEVLFKEFDSNSANTAQALQNVSGLTFAAENLAPFTRYHFRVRAYNHEGPGNFSESVIVRSKQEAPSKPLNLHILSKTSSELRLGWERPIQPNGIITKYDVMMSRDEDFWQVVRTPTVHGNDTKVIVKELHEYTEYSFKIRAYTIAQGDWSNVVTEKTMSKKPLYSPLITEITLKTPQSVIIHWQPPPASDYVGKIQLYKIMFTDDMRKKEEHWNSKLVPGNIDSIEVESLRSDTVYLFAMAAITENIGPHSSSKTIRTLRLGLPPPPREFFITNITAHSAFVWWTIDSRYHITNVRVRVKTINTLKWQDYLFHASNKQAVIESLEPGTKYEVEFIAVNYIGDSSSNPTLHFETDNESFIEQSLIIKIVLPLLSGTIVFLLIVIIVVFCKCRDRTSVLGGTESLVLDTLTTTARNSTIGSSQGRSGTLLSGNSVHSGNSRAPSMHSAQLSLPESLIIPWENIQFEDVSLGEGNFGQVVKAIVQKEDKYLQTAVKMLKDSCSGDDRKDFLAELDMMVRIGRHSNIISLIGACEHDFCLYLCTEYAPNGNLLQFLRRSRKTDIVGTYTSLTQNQLLTFALDVCQGMAYLSEKQLIHRDLAARNVLLSDHLTCKIGDFGLSRGEGVYVKKTVARLPIRWMAIESLKYNVYTTKSDVWSFGVLLWEIVSLGGTPYCGMSCAELYEKLPIGYRMERPLNCDQEVYKLMSQCWKDGPFDRPTFSQLCVALRRMLDARSSRNYVNTVIFDNFSFATIDANEEEA